MIVVGQSGTKHFFEQGNQAYRDGDYPGALEWYKKIVSAGYESSQVYYNMGNCYYKLDQIGLAILFYEKAFKINPRDREIKFNLEMANLKVVDRLGSPPQFFLFEWWDKIKTYFNIDQWTKLVAALYVSTILMLILFIFLRFHRLRSVVLTILIVFAALTVFASYLLFLNVRAEAENTGAIVLVPSVNVLSAPNENSTDVFVLHEGVKVNLSDQRGEWVEITLPDGKSGWMKRETLGVI
jgi:tetratricopeptide (TPR) repeat protein